MAVGIHYGRRAFTLVELLVVISIIGMLMALLLPAVQQAREAGRSNTCRNNLRNCTLANLNFESAKHQYPGFRAPLEIPGGPSPSTSVKIPVGWVVQILPYLERRDIYNLWKNPPQNPLPGTTWPPQVYIDVLNCPSSPPPTTDGSPCAYVANSGMSDVFPVAYTGNGPLPFPADFRANGVFFDQFVQPPNAPAPAPFGNYPPNLTPLVFTSQDYIAAHDGTSTTLMLSENNNVPLFAPSGSPPPGLSGGPGSWGDPATSGNERLTCFFWWPVKNPAPEMRINTPASSQTPTTSRIYFVKPASNHPGGVNVSFCDGHVRFLSETIDYSIYCLLMSPDNKICNSPGTVGGLDGQGGTPWDPSYPGYYHPGGDNYSYLRSAPLDEAKLN